MTAEPRREATAAPRRRRHDPLAPTGSGRVEPPGPSTIDLHTHTTRSDGVVGPATLVESAAAVGVRLLALTDHDTLAGYREVIAAGHVPAGPDARSRASRSTPSSPATSGCGRASSTSWGSGWTPTTRRSRRPSPPSAGAAASGSRRPSPSCASSTCRSTTTSCDVSGSDDDALGRPTVARALIAAGYATTVEDAFRRLLGWGMPGYVPRSGLGPVEAIQAIRAAGGLPALAHFSEAPAKVDVVRELAEAGLGGLEVYYRSFDTATVFAVGEVAAALGLVPTGGQRLPRRHRAPTPRCTRASGSRREVGGRAS